MSLTVYNPDGSYYGETVNTPITPRFLNPDGTEAAAGMPFNSPYTETARNAGGMDAWLRANGLIGPDGSLNLGDYGTGSPIGNSGLYKRNDENPEDFAARVYQVARGSNGEWGSVGRGFNDLQNAGFVNALAPVDMGGVQYQRVGENIADPLFRQKLIANNPKAQNITRFFDQYDPASVSKYDPTQGYLMQKDKYDELVRAIQSTRSGGVFAENTGARELLKMAASVLGAQFFGPALEAAGAGAEGAGLTLADAGSLATGTLTDAAPAAAGAIGEGASTSFSLSDLLKSINPFSAATTAAGGASSLFGGGQDGMLQSVAPTFSASTPTFTGPGTTGLNVSTGGSSFFSDLFTPKNLLSAGTNLIGSGVNALVAGKAADAQIDSTNASNSLIRDMYAQNRADLAPWRETGTAALGRLRDMLTPGKQFTALEADPGYQFRVDQGNKAIERTAAAKGKLFSPQTMNAVGERTQNVATGEFGNVTNRLLALAGLGQTATNTGVNAGQNAVTQQASNVTGAGNARASGYVGAANALSGGLSNFLRGMQEQDLMNLLMARA